MYQFKSMCSRQSDWESRLQRIVRKDTSIHIFCHKFFFFQHAPCVLQPKNKKTKQWNYNFGHFLKKKLKVKCVIFWQPRVGYVQSQSRCLSSAIFNNLVIVSNTKPHICKCHIVNFEFKSLMLTQNLQN